MYEAPTAGTLAWPDGLGFAAQARHAKPGSEAVLLNLCHVVSHGTASSTGRHELLWDEAPSKSDDYRLTRIRFKMVWN